MNEKILVPYVHLCVLVLLNILEYWKFKNLIEILCCRATEKKPTKQPMNGGHVQQKKLLKNR